MSMFRTGNPTLKDTTFVRATTRVEGVMTVEGTVNKTGIALLILIVSAAVGWNHIFGVAMILPTMWTGLIGGLILSLVTVFKTQWAPVTTPLYAVFEGLFIGTISLLFNVRYPGIAFNAAALTLAILAALLMAYRSGWIHPSENLKLGIAAATGGIALVYLVGLGLSFFGKSIPLIHGSGPIGIAFSLFVVALASANLVLDFDFIEQGAAKRAPKSWSGTERSHCS